MKQTYTNRYLDFAFVATSILSLIDAALRISTGFDYYSILLIRITFVLSASLSLVSLVSPQLKGERYSRFFVIINLLIPPVLALLQFLIDTVLYGVARIDHFGNPSFFINFIVGVILLIWSIRFSKEAKSKRINDYGLLTILIGAFIVVHRILLTIQSDIKTFISVAFVAKTIFGLLIMFLGLQLKNERIKFKLFLILLSVLVFLSWI